MLNTYVHRWTGNVYSGNGLFCGEMKVIKKSTKVLHCVEPQATNVCFLCSPRSRFHFLILLCVPRRERIFDTGLPFFGLSGCFKLTEVPLPGFSSQPQTKQTQRTEVEVIIKNRSSQSSNASFSFSPCFPPLSALTKTREHLTKPCKFSKRNSTKKFS